MSEVGLYSDLFDWWPDITTDLSTDFAKQVFENSYTETYKRTDQNDRRRSEINGQAFI